MMPRTHCPWRAHPRSRGENEVTPGSIARKPGSSPLTRGKHVQRPDSVFDDGLIPAHAGKTPKSSTTSRPPSAHPRSRGENTSGRRSPTPARGSSPLTRGKQSDGGRRTQQERLIPAHAGKTCRKLRRARAAAAHPRSRGENLNAPLVSAPLTGSSPLTRGKPPHLRAFTCGGRLIPAHAGKTTTPLPSILSWWAHPRSRGENRPTRLSTASRLGSSPLTRGKLAQRVEKDSAPRLIPAHAGKTASRATRSSWISAHPRSRGENIKAAAAVVVEWGSSPLTRGKLQQNGPGCRKKSAHPRSRGENCVAHGLQARGGGSSPLTRGKRVRARPQPARHRLIPAHAGKT